MAGLRQLATIESLVDFITMPPTQSVRESELAVIPLDHHVPYGFHGNFYPQTFV